MCAGKTSLLNVLAGRVPKGGQLTGEVLANGCARTESFRTNHVAYVMQEELLFPFLSTRETFLLHARLRLPPSKPEADKIKLVDALIAELGLKSVANSPVGRVGGFPRGLSGGERKRCNIGVEMVSEPLGLFLDEPTSGLDSFQAQNAVTALQDLARAGRTVVCTIHQPRSSIFAMFDQLILISEGRLMYIGDAHDAVGYFSAMHFKCPALTNPADFFMDVTSMDYRDDARERNSKSRVAMFAAALSVTGTAEAAVTAALADFASDPASCVLERSQRGGGANWLSQFFLLLGRAHRSQGRDAIGVGISVVIDMVYALLVSALFRQVGSGQKGVQDRIGCLFFITLNVAYTAALPAITLFSSEKLIVIRERASGAYACSAYYLSKYIAELPKMIPRLFFCVLVYWIVGFAPSAERFFIFVCIIVCEALCAQALGMLMATAMPVGAALALGPAIVTIFTLFGGIYLNR